MDDDEDYFDPFGGDGSRKDRSGRRPVPKPVRLGSADIGDIPFEDQIDTEEGGMIMGPHHPAFQPPSSQRPPTGQPPPGARHDPISPLRPFSGGEPDNDEFMPPGPEGDNPAQQPRNFIRPNLRGGNNGNRGGPFGGAPFFK